MAKKLKQIADNEKDSAAKYFTLSNLALLDLVHGSMSKNLDYMYSHGNEVMLSECGESIRPELNDWIKEVEKAKEGDYVFDEWQKVKAEYGFTS